MANQSVDEIREFTDLIAWKKAHQLVLELYIISREFPKEELFGMVSQLRRAAVSITGNISEGYGRYYYKDKMRFYYQSRGSLVEVMNLVLLARDFGWIHEEACSRLFSSSQEVRRLINGLIQSLQNQHA